MRHERHGDGHPQGRPKYQQPVDEHPTGRHKESAHRPKIVQQQRIIQQTVDVPVQKVGKDETFAEIEAHLEGEQWSISKKHYNVVRWGVALALAALKKDPRSALEDASEIDIMEFLVYTKGVRLSAAEDLFPVVLHCIRTMSSSEASYLAGLKSAPT